MKRHAVLYARKSSKEEVASGDTSKSVADQLEDLKRYAKTHGMDVVAALYDDAISGKRQENRPAFQEMLRLIEDGKVDTVVAIHTSRLGRDLIERELFMRDLDDRQVQVHAIEQGGLIDRSHSTGWLMDNINSVLDEKLWRDRSAGWRKTINRRLENGLPASGQARFGYMRDGRDWVPDPVTGPVLAEMYRRFIKGAGIAALARDLNKRGVSTTTGGQWTTSSVGRVLDRGFGAGLIYKRNKDGSTELLPGVHEPVITPDEWQAYSDRRANTKKEPPRRKTATWHLTGIVCCGLCGGRVHGRTQVALCGTYVNRGKEACTGTFMSRYAVEQIVTNWIGANIDAFPERDADVQTDDANHVRDLEERLEAVQARLVRLAEGYAEGILDTDGYRGAQAKALHERADVEAQLRSARAKAADDRPVTQDEWSRLELASVDGEVEPSEWNALLKRVLRRVEVHKDKVVVVPVIGKKMTIARDQVRRAPRRSRAS